MGCRTPTEGRDGVTNVPRWKFDTLRDAILKELSEGDFPFSELQARMAGALPEELLAEMGSLGWHATTVKLELEVRGEVARVDAKGPQVMKLGPNAPKGR